MVSLRLYSHVPFLIVTNIRIKCSYDLHWSLQNSFTQFNLFHQLEEIYIDKCLLSRCGLAFIYSILY